MKKGLFLLLLLLHSRRTRDRPTFKEARIEQQAAAAAVVEQEEASGEGEKRRQLTQSL